MRNASFTLAASSCLLVFAVGCSQPSSQQQGATGQSANATPATGAPTGQQVNNAAATPAAGGTLGSSQQGQAPVAIPGSTSSQQNVATAQTAAAPAAGTSTAAPAVTSQPAPAVNTGNNTIASKYAGYTAPSSALLDDPSNFEITNNTKAGIVSINSTTFNPVIPPQNTGVYRKYQQDLSGDQSTYSLTVTLDDGRTCQGSFDAMVADPQGWGIAVNNTSGNGCEVKQNAGGGNGGGNKLSPQNFDGNPAPGNASPNDK
jgi:hypothetical protein